MSSYIPPHVKDKMTPEQAAHWATLEAQSTAPFMPQPGLRWTPTQTQADKGVLPVGSMIPAHDGAVLASAAQATPVGNASSAAPASAPWQSSISTFNPTPWRETKKPKQEANRARSSSGAVADKAQAKSNKASRKAGKAPAKPRDNKTTLLSSPVSASPPLSSTTSEPTAQDNHIENSKHATVISPLQRQVTFPTIEDEEHSRVAEPGSQSIARRLSRTLSSLTLNHQYEASGSLKRKCSDPMLEGGKKFKQDDPEVYFPDDDELASYVDDSKSSFVEILFDFGDL